MWLVMPAGEHVVSFAQSLMQCFDHAYQVELAKMRMHRERQCRVSNLFAVREIARPITIFAKGGLQMEGHRIVNTAINGVTNEGVTQHVTTAASDDVEVITGFGLVAFGGKHVPLPARSSQ